jgi:hypothetical protein
MLQVGRSRVRNQMRSLKFFFNLPKLSSHIMPFGVYSASNRNEYQKQKNNVSGSRARPVRRADNLTAVFEPSV